MKRDYAEKELVNIEAGDVGRHDVRGELRALERKPGGLRDRRGKRGLSGAGDVLNQHVGAGEHGCHQRSAVA